MASIWDDARGIPRGPAAVLGLLAFDQRPADRLKFLTVEDWRQALGYADRAQLTLLLAAQDLSHMPEWVRGRIARNLSDNCERSTRMLQAYREAAAALGQAGVEFVVLKGFAHAPGSVPDERFRVQYDIDLYCRPRDVVRMRDVLLDLGYRPCGKDSDRVDHLPVMVRGGEWQWKGDYFDPDMPIAIEPHFRLWDPETERFEAPGIEEFWARRTSVLQSGLSVPALAATDALGYATLHALRHWLRGSLKAGHVYEIAYFLNSRADDEQFWRAWQQTHPARLRMLETLSFQLACKWFGCGEPPPVRDEIRGLPADIQRWFERFAASPVVSLFRPSKAELWLHWCLVEAAADRLLVARRRMLPARLPAAEEAHSPATIRTPLMRIHAGISYGAQLMRRASFHCRALAPAMWQAMTWRSSLGAIGKPFWTFLGAALLFNFGAFVFFVVYNLRLIDLGYREDVLGWITSAMTVGSIAGTLPAATLIARVRLRGVLLTCFAGVGVLSALRSVATGLPALLGTAFVAGSFLALWAVAIPPAVAQLTTERARARAFSLVFAGGIGTGVVAGAAAGWLASLMGKQGALLAGCAAMLLALAPASRLRFATGPRRNRLQFPRSSFILRFLIVVGLWTSAVGAFNPLFNAFFANKLGASPEWIGVVFSGAQFAQVLALLLAPILLRALGVTRAVAAVQVAAALALALLAHVPSLRAAAFTYALYTSLQYMSEPGLYTLLMRSVRPEEQAGASALNSLTVFSSQAIAATVAGASIAAYGYQPVMSVAAALACLAGLLFATLMRRAESTSPRVLAEHDARDRQPQDIQV